MTHQGIQPSGMHVIKLNSGADLLGALEKAVAERGIRNGVIACGVGSTTGCHVHVVKTTDLPPGNVFFKSENEPFDVVCMQGYIMNGRVHAHISLSRATDGSQIGGHLEEGCPVLTFCVVTIIETAPLGDLDTYPGQDLQAAEAGLML